MNDRTLTPEERVTLERTADRKPSQISDVGGHALRIVARAVLALEERIGPAADAIGEYDADKLLDAFEDAACDFDASEPSGPHHAAKEARRNEARTALRSALR